MNWNGVVGELSKDENKVETSKFTDNKDLVVDVLLICAMKDEYNQVLKVTDGLCDPGWVVKRGPKGWTVADGEFATPAGETLLIRATFADYMGRENTQAVASMHINHNPARCLAMSGICAGRRHKVALGDVIFAVRMWSYDAGKFVVEDDESHFQCDPIQYRPKGVWKQRMESEVPPLDASWLEQRPLLPLEHQEDWALLCFLDKEDPRNHEDFSVACPDWSDVLSRLFERGQLVNSLNLSDVLSCLRKGMRPEKSLKLTSEGRKKAEELVLHYPQELPAPAEFDIHTAPMATGAAVTEDDGIFPRLANVMRKVLGVEMEASAIAALGEVHDVPVIVAKGVSDFGDRFKDDRYRHFAARAAAECLIGFLRKTTDLLPGATTEVNTQFVSAVEEGVASIHEHIDEVSQDLENAVKQSGLHGFGSVAEHHDADAMHELQGILRRRASYGQDTLGELHRLANDVGNTGKFRAVSVSTKVEIYDWIARIAASREMLEAAEKAIAMVTELDCPVSLMALAWCDVARGDIDAALQRLRGFNDAESQSNLFGILRTKKGSKEALIYFDSLEDISPDKFTATGWRNVVSCLAEVGRVEDATRIYMSLPDSFVVDCPTLGYMGGIVCAAHLVPDDYKHRVIYEEFFAFSEHLLEGADADLWRQRAHAAFQLSIDAARDVNDSVLEKSAIGWIQWLRLIDPAFKEDELALLVEDMSDGGKAVELIPLAVAFRAKFDPFHLEKHLTRAEALGGLAPNELNAKLLFLRYFKRFDELVSFIEDNRERLIKVGNSAALEGVLIEAYVGAGECSRAEEILIDKETLLYSADVPRLRLMIKQCRGEDPTQGARELYEVSRTREDLWNLVMSLESTHRWGDLMPYALTLFELEQNAENMLRFVECLRHTNASEEDVMAFLNKRQDLVERNEELKSAQAWALFHLGEVEEARRLNDKLLVVRRNVNDLGLDMNLAARMGDWERFNDIIAREWERRSELPAHMLLHMSKLAGWGAKERAIQLAEEAVSQHPNDPNILIQAYGAISALAQDDIAMPWLSRAAQLSKGDEGPVKSYSFREMVEMMKDNGDDWQGKNDLFRDGKIPIHWAASMFNVPLSRFLIAIPRENKAQADARKRYPVPVRSGVRQPVETEGVQNLFLDITSVFILSELGLLSHLLNVVDQIYLSPRALEVLFQEREKVAFHQPSRIAAAKPLLELCRKGDIKVIRENVNKSLVEEVGDEVAVLLSNAKQSNGLCIHSGKLYRVGSYMDEEAELGEYSNYLSNPLVVARALYAEGRITSAMLDEALIYLGRVGNDEVSEADLSPGIPVFLDQVSTQYLAEAGLLLELINSGREVSVHGSTVDEWDSLVATEPHTAAMVAALENIRKIFRAGMVDGKVKFIREGRSEEDERFNMVKMPVYDLLEDGGRVDAVCIDDRILNANPFFEDRKSRRVPLICSLDVINMLVDCEEISDVDRRKAIHLMREWTLFALPVDVNELLHLLSSSGLDSGGELSEGAELRVIREYLARLHSADVLCTAQDIEYLDGLWRTGQAVVNKIWADETNEVEVVKVKAGWIVEHIIPDIELAMRFVPDREVRIEQVAIARLLTALYPPDIPTERRQAYADWLDTEVIAHYFPANSGIVKQITEQMSHWILERVKEVVNELEK